MLDTRKTTPGMRALEKAAVVAGGGANHRMGLFDRVLVKDNHLALAGAGLAGAVARARRELPGVLVEVEADDLAGVRAALDAGADWILLDNMTPERLREAVALVGRPRPHRGVGRHDPRGRPRGRPGPASTRCRSAPSPTRRRPSTWGSTPAEALLREVREVGPERAGLVQVDVADRAARAGA